MLITLEVDERKSGYLGRVFSHYGAVRGSPMVTDGLYTLYIVKVGRDNIVIA